MREAELLLLALMVALVALSALARLVKVPYPILLVLGGLVLGFAPGTPAIELPPELVLVLFLPPLLHWSGFFSSPRDLQADLGAISLAAVGLVLATMGAVAMTAHALIDGLPWAAAFALGAIVAPTDPLAATAIARRLGVPRRLVTILEGESLTNDATAPVAYRIAVAAAVGAASWSGRPACGSWLTRPAAWPSGSWSAGWSSRSAAGSTTPWSRSWSRW
jgi:monovalent cation/hydrogen antiporter